MLYFCYIYCKKKIFFSFFLSIKKIRRLPVVDQKQLAHSTLYYCILSYHFLPSPSLPYHSIQCYSIPFPSILFYSIIPFHSILFYHSISFYSIIPFHSVLSFPSVPFYSIFFQFHSILFIFQSTHTHRKPMPNTNRS